MSEWNNEKEIFKGAANMQYQKGPAAVLGYNKGGHLTLTDKRLKFEAHAFNVGQKLYSIPLQDIKQAENGFHILTPTPNMIKIELKSGEVYKFVVKGKEKETWKSLILEHAQKASVTIGTTNSVPKRRFCGNCGNKVEAGAAFCGNCGVRLV